MKHVVSIGGGISSTYLLLDKVLTKYGRCGVVPVICALSDENPDVWRLCDAVEKECRVKIQRIHGIVKGGQIQWSKKPISVWDIYFNEGIIGNVFVDPCSRMLKRDLMAAFMKKHFTPADSVMHVGIGAHEIDRMMHIQNNWARHGWTVEADLIDEPELTREKQIELCQDKFGFVPVLYRLGFNHNNCGGFCIKAGKGQFARLLWHFRPIYLEHERMELIHQRMFGHTNTVMKDERSLKGVRTVTPLTLRAFRLRMEAQWAGMLPGFDPFDGLDETPGCVFCESVA